MKRNKISLKTKFPEKEKKVLHERTLEIHFNRLFSHSSRGGLILCVCVGPADTGEINSSFGTFSWPADRLPLLSQCTSSDGLTEDKTDPRSLFLFVPPVRCYLGWLLGGKGRRKNWSLRRLTGCCCCFIVRFDLPPFERKTEGGRDRRRESSRSFLTMPVAWYSR